MKKHLRLVIAILAIAGIAVYVFLPNEKNTNCVSADKGVLIYPSGDSLSGVGFVNISPSSFNCSLLNESGICGLGFRFENGSRNWGRMDSLILNLKSSPELKEILVKILTNDPNLTKDGDQNSIRPLIKELSANPNQTRYSIPLTYFYVPDYWFSEHNIEKNNVKSLFSVKGIEILSGWKNPANSPLELQIESLCAEGISNTPFVILVIYICLLIGIAIGVRVRE
ncbi:hypothetical protein AGMMS49938_14700 [Fibrobacterales bacterium]|nr:hypothetical protein AGMMS49938_14660 [Fibrobacterales bacterium]GHV15721.1 hypothetical protein AGMMS49938_14700 [Fibrobacterales bacterium]